MASRESFEGTPRKNNLNRSFPQGLISQGKEGLSDDCVWTALALTALFDGEASVEEALLARTHRGECAECDTLWRAWEQQTQLLRHISAPVPPGLLTRILTAVRLLAAMPQMRARLEAKATRFEPQSGSVSDARLLPEVVFASGANGFAPRRSTQRFAPKIEAPRELPPLDPMAPLPPANLRDEILRRTIGTVGTVGEAGAPDKTSGAEPLAETNHILFEPQRSTRSRRPLRLSATLVPVLAAWLIFLSGPSGLWRPLLESETQPVRRTQRVAAQVKRNLSPVASAFSRPTVKNLGHDVALPDAAADNRQMPDERADAPEKSSSTEQPLEVTMQNTRETSAPLKASTVALTAPLAPATPSVTPVPALSKPVPTPVAVTVTTLPKVTPVVHHRPATTPAEMEVRTRRALWSSPTTDAPVTRTSTNPLAGNLVTAPQPATESDNAESDTDAETLEHVNRLNDARPDDVRSVLDDYRASLLAENPDEETELSATQG